MCNRLSTRIYKTKGIVQWESRAAKKEFVLQHDAVTGKGLKKELENSTALVEKGTWKDNDDAETHWLDEQDLVKKYEGKSDQLKANKETA